MDRRAVLKSALIVAGAPLASQLAWAQEFPNRTIRIVVPYAPGGASDVLSRAVAETMTKTLGQSAVVENRPGASGTTASEQVSRAAPDGHTLVMGTSASHSVNTVVFPKTYDPVTAFAPVALVTRVPNVIFVNPSLPVNTMAELVAYLKANPGAGIAVSGPATSGRFAAELLVAKLGLSVTIVPYGGSAPAVADVRAGHAKVGLTDLLAPTPFIRSGDVRAIAVTSMRRAPAMAQLPTVAETVSPGFDAVAWNALFAPPGTPQPILAKLNEVVRKTFEAPEMRARFEQLGQEVAIGSPAELTQFIQDDIARWKGVAASNKLTF